jgi:hypothetical protein
MPLPLRREDHRVCTCKQWTGCANSVTRAVHFSVVPTVLYSQCTVDYRRKRVRNLANAKSRELW